MPPPTSSNTLSSARPLRGKVALVTGATRGIGLAIARALAHQDCDLILTGRDQSALTRISRELRRSRIRVLAEPCDVRDDPHSVDDLFRSKRFCFPPMQP